MKILVVDDECTIVQGLVHHISMMAELSVTVTGAYSTLEALDVMEQFRPDLLITDIRMPYKDGFSLIEAAQKRHLCSRFIILTAYETFDYAKRALDFRVISYLVKPINWQQLDQLLIEISLEGSEQEEVATILTRYETLYAHTLEDSLSFTLKKLVKYVRKNYKNELSLSQISLRMGITENYICALFKKELGITFLDYVNELRLYHAMEALLLERALPIHDVALMVGYRSDRQLFRLFKSKLSMTPQQFREIHSYNTEGSDLRD